MTTVAILPELSGAGQMTWRAFGGGKESSGSTAGQALDALVSQLDGAQTSTLVVVQRLLPDRFFGAEQRQRLTTLMEHWRTARDQESEFNPADQIELDALVEAELRGAELRAEAIVDELGS
jgi:hypothetical protein